MRLSAMVCHAFGSGVGSRLCFIGSDIRSGADQLEGDAGKPCRCLFVQDRRQKFRPLFSSMQVCSSVLCFVCFKIQDTRTTFGTCLSAFTHRKKKGRRMQVTVVEGCWFKSCSIPACLVLGQGTFFRTITHFDTKVSKCCDWKLVLDEARL